MQGLIAVEGKQKIYIRGVNLNGGARRNLLATAYKIVDNAGKELARVDVPAGTSMIGVEIDWTPFPSDFMWVRAEPVEPTGESCPPWAVLVTRGGKVENQTFIPFGTGTESLVRRGLPYWWGELAPEYKPREIPLPDRGEPEHFSDVLPVTELYCEQVVPARFDDQRRIYRSKHGALTTYGLQEYFGADREAVHGHRLPVLEGERGANNAPMASDVWIGRKIKVYAHAQGAYLKILRRGKLEVLTGTYDAAPPPQWQDVAGDALSKGDWTGVPEPHTFNTPWAARWWPRSVIEDVNAAPIPAEDNERPHVSSPTCFHIDTANGRILKAEYPPDKHGVPPKMSVFKTGLNLPWSADFYFDWLIVAEQGAHRVMAYNVLTGEEKVLLQGAALATIRQPDRVAVRKAGITIEQCRAEPCVAPEGNKVVGGVLYVWSNAQALLRKWHLNDADLSVPPTKWVDVPLPQDSLTSFANGAVSDGSFYPAHTTFTCMWTNASESYGNVLAHLPDGTPIKHNGWMSFGQVIASRICAGHGGNVQYPISADCRDGQLVFSGSSGIFRITKRKPGETPPSALVLQGEKEWESSGKWMVWGDGGLQEVPYPLPWGESEAIDAYLRWWGHA